MSVMTAASIPAARGGDYARYLEGKTVAPERGDYYLTPDGEMTQAPGRWLADPQTLGRLGIETTGPAAGEDFVALMEGRHPQTGRWLRRAGADGHRGGGIDGTFSAPKSVSVAWALADPWQRAQIEQAHANAVEQAVVYMRERVPLVRRRYGAGVVEEPAKDLIAVEYRHTTARGVSGADAPDPQLHSHVVITSVVREDDRIVAVASRPVFRAAGEVGAFYRSVLAQQLIQQGYPIEQATGKHGKYSRWRVSRSSFAKRSRAVHARSRGLPTGSVRVTVVHPRRGSFATSRSRTGAQRRLPTAPIWSVHGGRPRAATDDAGPPPSRPPASLPHEQLLIQAQTARASGGGPAPGRYGHAIVLPHAACELAIARATRRLIAEKAPDLQFSLEELISRRWSLSDTRVAGLWNALAGDDVHDAAFWQDYKAHLARRQAVVHEGAAMSVAEADASIDVAQRLCDHVTRLAP